jgi:hypothetical protein
MRGWQGLGHSTGEAVLAENSLGSSAAVEKHMDQMEVIVTTFVIPVLVVLLAAADIPKGFEILGIHLKTEDAYGMVVAIFDCLLLLFCTTCWKAADLLKACGEGEANRAIVAVVTHKWVLNPFSYSGTGILSAANCAVGAALLTFSWWGGLSSLRLLSGVTHDRGATEACLYALYFVLGVAALAGLSRFMRLIAQISARERGDSNDEAPLEGRWFRRNIAMKCAFSGLASILGFWLYYSFAHVA